MKEDSLLDDLAPPKKVKRQKHNKFHSTKGVSLDIALRRQVAAELGEDEPTKDQRYVLLQKFGVVNPKIDRLMTKPEWMGVTEWKRKQNEWYKATKGLVAPQQQRRSFRPIHTSSTQNLPAGLTVQTYPKKFTTKPWPPKFRKDDRNPRQDTRTSHPNSGRDRTASRQS